MTSYWTTVTGSHQAHFATAICRALDAATEALHLIQSNYQAGLADYTNVLMANAQFHQAKISGLESRAQRYQDTVALLVALGGSWWNKEAGVAKR